MKHADSRPIWTAGVTAAAFLVLLLRRPETLTTAEFFADDAHFYQDALTIGPPAITVPYAGYLSIIQRMAALGEVLVPPVWAPFLGNLLALGITALVAAFLASDRMSVVLPDRRWRVVLSLVFVMLPAAIEVSGSMRDIGWIVSVYMLAMLLATPPTSGLGRYGDAAGLFVAGLTGPTSILLWPLYLIRASRDRAWRWHILILTGAVSIQVAVLSMANRVGPAPTDWALVPGILLNRGLVQPVTGVFGPGASPILVVIVAAALVLATWHLPRAWVFVAFVIAVMVPLAGIRATETPTAVLQDPVDPFSSGRYFYLTGVVFAGMIVLALARGSWLAIPAAALLCLGMVMDARLPAVPPAGWAEQAACIGGPATCFVPVQPEPRWAVHWP